MAIIDIKTPAMTIEMIISTSVKPRQVIATWQRSVARRIAKTVAAQGKEVAAGAGRRWRSRPADGHGNQQGCVGGHPERAPGLGHRDFSTIAADDAATGRIGYIVHGETSVITDIVKKTTRRTVARLARRSWPHGVLRIAGASTVGLCRRCLGIVRVAPCEPLMQDFIEQRFGYRHELLGYHRIGAGPDHRRHARYQRNDTDADDNYEYDLLDQRYAA